MSEKVNEEVNPEVDEIIEDEILEETEVAEEVVEETETAEELTEEVDPVTELESRCKDLEDKYLRKVAEFENFKRRKTKDLDDTRNYAKANTIEEFLTVVDQFDMAISAIETAPDLETMKQGMLMIQNTFQRSFENLGVEKMKCVGQPFDPNFHDAVTKEASEEVPEDSIIREWKPGYKLGDRLLRPASVVVSSGPASAEEDAE